jgi:hypothetical protein
MQNYMWLASIFGPFLLILGIWGLFYRDNMDKVCASVKAHPAFLYILAIFNLWFGLVIITFNNYWFWDRTLFVTVLGWALAVRGVICLFAPQLMLKHKGNKTTCHTVKSTVFLVWGFILCWIAFLMQ